VGSKTEAGRLSGADTVAVAGMTFLVAMPSLGSAAQE
jgi:hypothetical protein